MLEIEAIRSVGDFAKVREGWAQLQSQVGEDSIFLSYDWLRICAANLSAGQELLILLVRDNDQLVGAAPLVRSERRIRRMPVTRIEFLRNEISPFGGFLMLDSAQSLQAVLAHLHSVETNWDVLWLSGMRETAALQVLSSALPEHRFQRSVVSQTPYLGITSNWDDFYNSKSRKFRMTKRSITNRIHRLEGVEVQHFAGVDDAAKGLELLLEVSSKSWKRRQECDLIDAGFEKKFFTELTMVASERGWLHIWVLMTAGKPVAAEYHLQSGPIVYGLRAHYNDDLSFYSPGVYLDLEIVKALHERAIECYDMGPGVVDYKLAWTEEVYPLVGLELFNQTAYAQCLNRLHNSVIPAIKRSGLARQLQRLTHKEA